MIEKTYQGSGLRGLLWGSIETSTRANEGVARPTVTTPGVETWALPVIAAEVWIEEVIDENDGDERSVESARWPALPPGSRGAEQPRP